MPVYKGRRKETFRVVLWARLPGTARSRSHEWIVKGSKRDAEEFEAKKRLELAAGQTQDFRAAPSFSEFSSNHYRPHAEKHLKASTWRKVRIYQVATLEEFFGDKRLTSIQLADIEAFKAKRLAKGNQPSSVNNELRVLRTMWTFATDLGFRMPVVKWKKLPVRGKGRARAWSDAEIQKLFHATKSRCPELLPVLVFLLNTGCRKGEAIAAEWTWVDLPGKMLRIPSNEFWQPKTDEPREIPLGPALMALLAKHPTHGRWVFVNRDGNRYAEFPKDIFWDILDEAGITGTPHMTRHTFASHFLKKVPDLFLLSKVLGHSQQRTSELYSHMLGDHLKRARGAVHLVPETKTMARTMAKKRRPAIKPDKKSKRH